MKYLIDKIDSLSKQSVSAAAITDSSGNLAGKVLVRFTQSYIGWNHEVVAFLFGKEGMRANNSKKGGTYENPTTLYKLINEAGLKCFDYNKRKFGHYDKGTVNIASMSQFSDIRYIKDGNKLYTLHWVI